MSPSSGSPSNPLFAAWRRRWIRSVTVQLVVRTPRPPSVSPRDPRLRPRTPTPPPPAESSPRFPPPRLSLSPPRSPRRRRPLPDRRSPTPRDPRRSEANTHRTALPRHSTLSAPSDNTTTTCLPQQVLLVQRVSTDSVPHLVLVLIITNATAVASASLTGAASACAPLPHRWTPFPSRNFRVFWTLDGTVPR